ncbi:MAG: hypothetical protein ACLUE1_06760 [Adlercreutzia equolifaciens]
MEATGAAADIAEKRDLLEKIDALRSRTRCWHAAAAWASYPILPEMQVRAIATACARLQKEGFSPKPEIMIPLGPCCPSSRSCAAWPRPSSPTCPLTRASSWTSPSAP